MVAVDEEGAVDKDDEARKKETASDKRAAERNSKVIANKKAKAEKAAEAKAEKAEKAAEAKAAKAEKAAEAKAAKAKKAAEAKAKKNPKPASKARVSEPNNEPFEKSPSSEIWEAIAVTDITFPVKVPFIVSGIPSSWRFAYFFPNEKPSGWWVGRILKELPKYNNQFWVDYTLDIDEPDEMNHLRTGVAALTKSKYGVDWLLVAPKQ